MDKLTRLWQCPVCNTTEEANLLDSLIQTMVLGLDGEPIIVCDRCALLLTLTTPLDDALIARVGA